MIQKLFSKPYLFRRIITLDIEEFEMLVEKLEPEWEEREKERLLLRKDRKNAIGQGRNYALGDFSKLLFATLLYLRTNMGYELLGLFLNIDQTTVKRVIKRVMPLLQDRFIPKTELTKYKRRTNKLDEFLESYPELKEVIFDGTELSSNRPKKGQKKSYSGKKKRHTKKNQVAIDKNTKIIIGLSPPEKGKIHDKKQLEKTGWDQKLSQEIMRYGDLGYLGMKGWIIPHKKPRNGELTKKQKRENRKISKKRIYVEHAIRGMKIFRRIGEKITVKSNESLNSVILASANLYNFKRLVRQGLC